MRKMLATFTLLALFCALAWANCELVAELRREKGARLLPTPAPALSLSSRLLAAHNHARADHDLAPLSADPTLDRQAQEQAGYMARAATLAHGLPGAENIGWNYPDIPAVMAGWMASTGHRRNILGPYTRFGGGLARSSSGQPYWCARFQ